VSQPLSAASAGRPSVLDDRALLGHPRGLGLLFVVEMWERFSYYGMRAFLILYLVHALGWSDRNAASLYGLYTSAVYLTPLVGGYLADRFIGTRRSVVLGSVVIALGHFSLAVPSTATFYLGLGLIIAGTGFFKPNAATMVGQIYRPGDPRRDSGFTIYYMGVNAGALAGPFICGALAEYVGWHWGFGAAGVGMVAGLVVYLIWRDEYLPGIGVKAEAAPDPATATHAATDLSMLVQGAAGAATGGVLAWLVTGWAIYPLLIGAAIGAVMAITILGTHGAERRRVLAIYLAAVFVVFFWTAYEQAGSSMNLFADRHTDMVILGHRWPRGSSRSTRS
jgi:POT family proton-dependent oligopeptide transporter